MIAARISVGSVLFVVGGLLTASTAAAYEECTGVDAEGASISLEEVWEESIAAEPAVNASALRQSAARSEVGAIEGERRPQFSIQAQGDMGQRARPGEERDEGFGVRGDILGSTTWTLLDSEYGPNKASAQRLQRQEQLSAQVVELEVRAVAARLYVEAAVAAERLHALERWHQELNELRVTVEERVSAGVENHYEQAAIEDALVRSERVMEETRYGYEAALIELAMLVGRCVRPDHFGPDLDGFEYGSDGGQQPEVQHLLARAETRDASAKQIEVEGAWQAGLRGVVGLYGSQAYERAVLPEYYVGIFGLWNPDLSGVRQDRARAERQRASALRAEAKSLQVRGERQSESWAQVDARARQRSMILERERESARSRLQKAQLRWREGVGSWTEVLSSTRRLEEATLAELDFRREVALALVEFGVSTGRLEELAAVLQTGK